MVKRLPPQPSLWLPPWVHSRNRHPEFTLQWWGAHGGLSASSELWCVRIGGAFPRVKARTCLSAAFSALLLYKISWWIGYPLLGRGRLREASDYFSNLIYMTLLAWVPREFSNVTAAGFCWLICYLVLLVFLPSWALWLMCVWFIPSSCLYKEQIYWGTGHLHYMLPLGVLCQPGTIHVLSCERERGPGSWHISVPISTAAALSSICWSALNHKKYLRATSSGALSRGSPTGFQVRGQTSESSSPYICL